MQSDVSWRALGMYILYDSDCTTETNMETAVRFLSAESTISCADSCGSESTLSPHKTPIKSKPLVGVKKPASIGEKQLRAARVRLALKGVSNQSKPVACPLGNDCEICSGSMWKEFYPNESSWATQRVAMANLRLGRAMINKDASAMHPVTCEDLEGQVIHVKTLPCGDPLYLFDTGNECIWLHEVELKEE